MREDFTRGDTAPVRARRAQTSTPHAPREELRRGAPINVGVRGANARCFEARKRTIEKAVAARFVGAAVGAALALGWALAACSARAADQPAPLNIVFCFADDWGRYAGCYGALGERPSPSDVARTPHIDAVAKEGVLFRHAFVDAPSCTPCRSSLLSGRYFFRTGRGAILNGAVWDDAIPSFPLLLRDAGFHIGETYKVWSPGRPNDAPFGAGKYAYEKAGREINNFSENATRMTREGKSFEEAKQKMLDDVRGNFNAFLKARPSGQPFCYWFGPTNVHRLWTKGSGKALWGVDPDALRGKLPKFLPDVPEVRQDFADYLGEIQAFDAAVGALLEQLRAAGEYDRTLIVISGDHGPPGFPGGKCNLYDFGARVPLVIRAPGRPGGRVVDDFTTLMDLAPTFLEASGVKPPAEMNGRGLWNVLNSDKQGLVDDTRVSVLVGRERHVGSARAGNKPYPQRALRNQRWLYIRNFAPDRWPMGDPGAVTDAEAPSATVLENNTRAAFADCDASPTKAWLVGQRHEPRWRWHYEYAFGKRPAEELYDVVADPDQVINLAGQAEHAATRARLSEELTRRLAEAGDPRVTGDGQTFERPPFTDPE